MSTSGAIEVTASAAAARPAIDRTASAERGGSVLFVLLVAGILVGAATGIVVLGRSNSSRTFSASRRGWGRPAASSCSRLLPAVRACFRHPAPAGVRDREPLDQAARR